MLSMTLKILVKILFLTGKVCKTMLCVTMILSFCVKDAFYVALAKPYTDT